MHPMLGRFRFRELKIASNSFAEIILENILWLELDGKFSLNVKFLNYFFMLPPKIFQATFKNKNVI